MNPLIELSLKVLSRNRLSVFLFHALPRTSPDIPEDFTITEFEETLHFIRQQFNVVPLADAVKAMQRGRLEARTACLTFDDGYPSWVSGVAPLLKQAGMPATFYVTTGQFSGTPMWHVRIAQAINAFSGQVLHIPGFGLAPLPMSNVSQRRHAFFLVEQFLKYQPLEEREVLLAMLEQHANVVPEAVPNMSVEQLKTLAAMGFAIGAHTHRHPILNLCDRQEAIEEIGSVRENLQSLLRCEVDSFAYPNGRPLADFSKDHVAIVRAAGYRHAVTTDWGAASPRTSPFEIPRFTPWGPTPNRMALQMARNLLTRAREVGSAPPARPPRVMVVENGAGFGGAVVALKSLVGSMTPEDAEISIVTNIPIDGLDQFTAVKRICALSDRVIDARQLAIRVSPIEPAWLRTLALFCVGRLDDVVNRLPYFLRLGWHMIRIGPDIVHGNNEPNSNREAMLVSHLLRIPFVQHVRGPLVPTRLESWLLSVPSAFVPVSRWLAGELLVRGVAPHRIRQVYDGVDMKPKGVATSIDLRSELGLGADTLLVALVGMLVQWKGQDLFIEAINHIGPMNRPVVFLLFGDTPEHGDASYADRLREKVASFGLEKQVKFMGRHSNLTSLLPQVNVMVSASTEPEPLGLVMIEAMANGCVFVAPAFGAALEVIQDGVTGFLFAPRDPISLGVVLGRAISETKDHTELLNRAYQNVSSRFSPRQCLSKTLRLYEAVAPL